MAGGCASSRQDRSKERRDRAFTVFWPREEGSDRLRLAVKDLIDMKGVVTTAGSEYLAKHNAPAEKDAACLAIARERNVHIVGRTNVTEFAITVSGINDYFGTPRNRVSQKHKLIPGGSSSGSAVAVANNRADVAFGTDTAGSIRVPAACCGVVGLKTTFGLVPLDGVFPIAPKHLDTVGPMARTVDETAQGMDLLQRGFLSKYQQAKAEKPSARRIKVGRLRLSGTSKQVDDAIDAALAATGFQVVPIDRSFRSKWEQAQKDAKTVATANAWLHDRQYASQRGVSVKTKAVITLGQIAYATGAYESALSRQKDWQRTMKQVFQKVDCIALPTMQQLPPRVPPWGGSPVFEDLVFSIQNTEAVNWSGNPAIAIPVPVDDKYVRVTSLQLIGPRKSEAQLLNAGRLVEAKVKAL